jgi:hypothetical protein
MWEVEMPPKGSKQSEEAKQKIRESQKARLKDPNKRLKLIENAHKYNKERIIQLNVSRRGQPTWNSGKSGIYSQETLNKMSEAKRGVNHPCFKNWSSYEPYCELFNEDLKTRCREWFGNKCFMCGIDRSELNKNLGVHHIWAEKKACCEDKMSIEEMDKFRARLPEEIASFGSDTFTEIELSYLRMMVPVCPHCHNITIWKDTLELRKELTDKLVNEFGGKCFYTQKEFEVL